MGLTRVERFQRNTGGVLYATAALAFFISPLVSFGHPLGLAIGGIILAVAIIGLYNVHVLPNMQSKPKTTAFAYIMLFLAALVLGVTFLYAYWNTSAVASQCRKLQIDMIQGVPNPPPGTAPKTYSPPHDAFTALRCRPVDLSS